MGVLPILQKNSNQRACLGNKNLPANYMSDYSVMGLVVGRLDAGLNKNRRMSNIEPQNVEGRNCRLF